MAPTWGRRFHRSGCPHQTWFSLVSRVSSWRIVLAIDRCLFFACGMTFRVRLFVGGISLACVGSHALGFLGHLGVTTPSASAVSTTSCALRRHGGSSSMWPVYSRGLSAAVRGSEWAHYQQPRPPIVAVQFRRSGWWPHPEDVEVFDQGRCNRPPAPTTPGRNGSMCRAPRPRAARTRSAGAARWSRPGRPLRSRPQQEVILGVCGVRGPA
jgi:hypothetical protein